MEPLAPLEIDPATFLQQHCSLPPLPEVVTRIQELVQSESAVIGDVVELISGDPALVAQLLKIVNSSYYGLPQEVAKIQFAVAFLGFSEVYRMVLSVSVINTLSVTAREELERFWFHSFYASLCVKHLAKKYEPQLSFEELWSAAILHDIGKLVYLKFFPDHYQALVRTRQEQGCLFSQAETDLSLPASSTLGVLLCGHWRLPAKIRDACESHSLEALPGLNPDTPGDAFKRMICLGNLMAVLAADELNKQTRQQVADGITASLACSESDFLAMMGEVYELRIQVDEFMSRLK